MTNTQVTRKLASVYEDHSSVTLVTKKNITNQGVTIGSQQLSVLNLGDLFLRQAVSSGLWYLFHTLPTPNVITPSGLTNGASSTSYVTLASPPTIQVGDVSNQESLSVTVEKDSGGQQSVTLPHSLPNTVADTGSYVVRYFNSNDYGDQSTVVLQRTYVRNLDTSSPVVSCPNGSACLLYTSPSPRDS